MAGTELIDQLWEASKSGVTLREEWLSEFIRHRDGVERLRALIVEADPPTQAALAELLHEFADAPRRNARKPRRGKEWWPVLATYLRAEGPATQGAMLALIPNEHEESLKLSGGKFEFHQRIGESRAGVKGPLVCCEFADGREPDEISFSTFERHLKKAKPR